MLRALEDVANEISGIVIDHASRRASAVRWGVARGVPVLLLSAGCAHRAYYVFGPNEKTESEVAGCQLDFRDITLGTSTVASLKAWYAELGKQEPCKEVKLRFHRPGDRLKGEGIDPGDTDIILQIAIDSDPERPRLNDAAVVRAIVATETPKPDSTSLFVFVETERTVTRWRTEEKEVPVYRTVHRDIPDIQYRTVFVRPQETTDSPASRGGDGKKRAEKESANGSAFKQAVAPALVGGGIIYALAYFQMLPLVGAGMSPRPRLKRPSWGPEEPLTPAVTAAEPSATGEVLRDPRVRVAAQGLRRPS